ncbi:MAG TPA: hypothetical protein VGW39_10595 [Chthoniobacterales bacterium]|nr:hypothetical protein [Chthoniobacterales bacterium]
MKKLTLGFCALIALGSAAFAGTEITTESKAVVPPPCPQWYADNEFNLSISGIYAFSGNENTFLDHGWGGAVDAKYFFARYFGIGVQGFLLDANTDDDDLIIGDDDDSDGVGGILGTFTFRFPSNCSRFAPYVWVGGGGIWGGQDNRAVAITPGGGIIVADDDDDEGHGMGQVGGGFEFRFTPHCGWVNDFSWNIVSGSNNNFGMARTGINFAF